MDREVSGLPSATWSARGEDSTLLLPLGLGLHAADAERPPYFVPIYLILFMYIIIMKYESETMTKYHDEIDDSLSPTSHCT